jgi:hypothetical protein
MSFFEKNCLLRLKAATRLAAPQKRNFPNHMIKTSHTARLRLSYSVAAATTLLISGQFATAAKVDTQILAARTTMGAQDIESIAATVKSVADQFGTNSIKMSGKNVKSIASYAADAIAVKVPDPLNLNGPNRLANKTDEIAEAAALIINGMAGNAKFAKLGKAKILTVTAMKGVLKNASKNALFTSSTLFRDVAGSVALTLANKPALDGIQVKLAKYLNKKAKGIAGKINQVFIQTGFTAGFLSDTAANATYEDGAIVSLFLVVDPETDQRPA